MKTPPPPPGQRLLGRGRSAVVYRATGDDGRPVARKVFVGDRLGSLIHLFFTGATNPYTWNEHAIGAAMARRRILNELVGYWFGDDLRIPQTFGSRFDHVTNAYEIRMEVVRGVPAPLHHMFTGETDGLQRSLSRTIMRPLQQHLERAGFDGLVWQAGRSNPVAASNFLLERGADGRPDRWVWLDLESGVPALFPINPITLLRFYIPKSFRHGGALFDDTDTDRLHSYLDEHAEALRGRLGDERYNDLLCDAGELAQHQRQWRATGRFENSILAALKRGRIDEDQAAFYRRRPVRWYTRQASRALTKLRVKLRHRLTRALPWVNPVRLRQPAAALCRFCTSGSYRMKLSRGLLLRRVHSWRRRGQLSAEEAKFLRGHIRSNDASAYLTDFGVHLALKPPVKVFEYFVLPALATAGVISPLMLVIGIATGGMLARTAYTASRTIQAYHKGEPRPWIALLVGLFPVVGNGAYPAQIIVTSAKHGKDESVAQFLIYDISTALGAKIPIWGGRDTQTEHFFNRLPDLLLSRRRTVIPAPVANQTLSPAVVVVSPGMIIPVTARAEPQRID